MLKLRQAVKADSEQILNFIKELAEYEKLTHEVIAQVSDIENTVFSEDSKTEVIMAEYAGVPVGFALYFYNYSTFIGKYGIYLEDLYVKPEFRGKRIGFSLLQKLAQIAVEKDCARVDWSVLDWNQPAIDFYKSIGAKPQSGWSVFRLTGQELVSFSTK